jgi:hypothetical protein
MSALSISTPVDGGPSDRAESIHRDDPTDEDRAAAEQLRPLRAPRHQDDDDFIDDDDYINDDSDFVVTKVIKGAGITARSIKKEPEGATASIPSLSNKVSISTSTRPR